MNHLGEISIQQVLADIREGGGKPFHLQFVRATGKTKGTVKTVAKAIYGRSKTPGVSAPTGGSDRKRALHIDKGTLPLTDYESSEYFTPLIACITAFNGYKVIH